MFLRSRPVVRHSCSGLLLRTEAGWLLMRSESRERANALPPITTTYYHVNPWPRGVSLGSERGRTRGEEQRRRKLKACCGWGREEQMCADVQVERPTGKMIRDRSSDSESCWSMLSRGSLMSPLFMNIWAVNLSVQPQKVPLTAECDFAGPPALSVVFVI